MSAQQSDLTKTPLLISTFRRDRDEFLDCSDGAHPLRDKGGSGLVGLTGMARDFSSLPVLDIGALVNGAAGRRSVSDEIGRACRESGFFYIIGHGIDDNLQRRLEELSRNFFALNPDEKLDIRMEKAGRAWRGYFPIGGELTSGQPDLKEGLYFGTELDRDHPQVKLGTPMHGSNLFPNIALFRETVLDYIAAMTMLGHKLMEGIAMSLELEESFFSERYTRDPLILFRIFNYPPNTEAFVREQRWGVGAHTDYGLLTILRQDETGGLEVKSKSGWVDAKPIPGSFVCNIGDMLDRMTGGLYRSTPHRVRCPSQQARLSFPFFFDPNFNAEVKPITINRRIEDDRDERWDLASVHDFSGTYGDYLLNKVARVFPQLRREIL